MFEDAMNPEQGAMLPQNPPSENAGGNQNADIESMRAFLMQFAKELNITPEQIQQLSDDEVVSLYQQVQAILQEQGGGNENQAQQDAGGQGEVPLSEAPINGMDGAMVGNNVPQFGYGGLADSYFFSYPQSEIGSLPSAGEISANVELSGIQSLGNARAQSEDERTRRLDTISSIGKGIAGIGSRLFGYGIKGLLPVLATGGAVDAEVEGGEVYQKPDGSIGRFVGQSHEQGGIQTTLPAGTNIYSKRLEEEGRNMADRKMLREKRQMRAERYVAKNPTDPVGRKTLQRILETNEQQEQRDMDLQNLLHELLEQNRKQQETIDYQASRKPNFAPGGQIMRETVPMQPVKPIIPDLSFSVVPATLPAVGVSGTGSTASSFNWGNIGNLANGFVGGALNILPKVISHVGDWKRKKNNDETIRALEKNQRDYERSLKPNINPYKDFGSKGLSALQRANEELNRSYEMQKNDIRQNTMRQRDIINQNTASVNALRNMQSVATAQENKALNDAYQQQLTKRMAFADKEANQYNSMDSVRMKGEDDRDINNRSQIANIFANRAANIQTKHRLQDQNGQFTNNFMQNMNGLNIMDNYSKYGNKAGDFSGILTNLFNGVLKSFNAAGGTLGEKVSSNQPTEKQTLNKFNKNTEKTVAEEQLGRIGSIRKSLNLINSDAKYNMSNTVVYPSPNNQDGNPNDNFNQLNGLRNMISIEDQNGRPVKAQNGNRFMYAMLAASRILPKDKFINLSNDVIKKINSYNSKKRTMEDSGTSIFNDNDFLNSVFGNVMALLDEEEKMYISQLNK